MGTLVVYIGITVCIMIAALIVFLFPCVCATIASGVLISQFGLGGTIMPPGEFSGNFGGLLILIATIIDLSSFKWRTWWRD